MLPTFLIIGAQKSGTTTLYRDLLSQPGVYFPFEKEPTSLAHDKVLTPEGRAEYEALYIGAKATDARGDASTGYARIPRFTGVPERAMQLLGPDTELLYIVREPVSRMVSHHHHMITNLPMPTDFDEFLKVEPNAVAFSRYAWQAKAWLEHFDRSKLHILIFEEYVVNRREVVASLGPILGFAPRVERVDIASKFNAAEDRSSDRGLAMRFRSTRLYQAVRPLLPVSTRDALRRRFASKAPPPPPPPSRDRVEQLLRDLEPDHRELAELMERPYPIWDPELVRERYDRLRATR